MNLGFQRRTDLALGILRSLAERGERMSGAELAERVATTITYLPQVVASLIQAGWVSSDRGPGGGNQLTAAAGDVRLLEVIEATEGPADDGRCALGSGPGSGEISCPIHAEWSEARQVLIEGFGQVPAVSAHSQGDQQ
ncbi:MAG: RrF2 family transcriptional regulator [Acidimicrobiia bacterium]